MKATTRRFNLYIDEFGYQTNPPDKAAGISLTQQDQWLQRGAYQAWRNPRVKLFSQYLWRDEPRSLNSTFGGWQSGPAVQRRSHQAVASSTSRPRSRSTPTAAGCGVRCAGATPSSVTLERRLPAVPAGGRSAPGRPIPAGYWSWQTRLVAGASYRYRAAAATSATLKRR